MSNEEKILSILISMQSDITSMQSDIAELKANQAEMQDTLKRVAATQEIIVLPRLQALYEGHDAIMHQLKGKADAERVEVLEDHTNMLHNSVKQLRVDVDALKKAQ